jgi:hypothetical protein
MATLRSHGPELCRCEKTTPRPDSATTSSSRETYALMADGAVLRRYMVEWTKVGPYSTERWHNYGWKLFRQASSKGKTLSVDTFMKHFEARGYSVTMNFEREPAPCSP